MGIYIPILFMSGVIFILHCTLTKRLRGASLDIYCKKRTSQVEQYICSPRYASLSRHIDMDTNHISSGEHQHQHQTQTQAPPSLQHQQNSFSARTPSFRTPADRERPDESTSTRTMSAKVSINTHHCLYECDTAELTDACIAGFVICTAGGNV